MSSFPLIGESIHYFVNLLRKLNRLLTTVEHL